VFGVGPLPDRIPNLRKIVVGANLVPDPEVLKSAETVLDQIGHVDPGYFDQFRGVVLTRRRPDLHEALATARRVAIEAAARRETVFRETRSCGVALVRSRRE